MADYFSPTAVQQVIPNADMTPLERLLLTHIFSAEPDGDGLYFYAEEGPADMIVLSRAVIDAALAASQAVASTANAYVAKQLLRTPHDEPDIDLGLSGISWGFIFQDIVRRSSRLRYVTAVTSFTCSRMRRTVSAAGLS